MAAWLMSSCPVFILKLKDNCPSTELGTGDALLFAFNLSVSQAFVRLSKQSHA